MRLLADMHIAPRTVGHLRNLGHDIVRVDDVLEPTATDHQIVAWAAANGRCILTQDLDVTTIVALSGATAPSVVTLRLRSSRIEAVNGVLDRVLGAIEANVTAGALITVEDDAIRTRWLPARP